eukprot:CAMPEP_0182489332 /NCGR_PEP_ID=MMETSP1319-20130603/48855_1 /TAXON_ID=172717 /ORGANISM="Bolidomonas pacifica, Strain RCC208" /LENGTH=77 /DNA_ID=CAMNT_0024691459 /DNA_START=112 /DNA_END=345 /DNA_ORIENTATION=-
MAVTPLPARLQVLYHVHLAQSPKNKLQPNPSPHEHLKAPQTVALDKLFFCHLHTSLLVGEENFFDEAIFVLCQEFRI